MSRARLVVLAGAVLIGVFLLIVANDVRSWRDTMRNDALTIQAGGIDRAPATILPSGLSEALLSAGRDRDRLIAVQKFLIADQASKTSNALRPGQKGMLKSVEAALARVTQDPNRAQASQAYNLLGVLESREAFTPGKEANSSLVQQSLADLQNAVRVDPTDEPAKENLEHVFRLIAIQAPRKTPAKADTGNRGAVHRTGNYGGPPGVGY
jgi:hypothetical protein